jgi:hypothetical protein
MGGGKHGTIIVEALPARPIIPPFLPTHLLGATPEPHPALPLDTEIGKTGAVTRAPTSPAKTAATTFSRDG